MQLPLFPLSSIVMPGGLLPLRLFERRYLDMISNCFKTGTGFGVCLIRKGDETGQSAEPYPMGTEVKIVDFDQSADGLLQITAEGVREFSVLSYAVNADQLIVGEVEPLEEQSPTEMSPDFDVLAQKLDLILTYVEPNIQYFEKQLDNPDWVCHRLLELLPLDRDAKWELLQMANNCDRLHTLSSLQIDGFI